MFSLFTKFGGRKSTALFLGLILPSYIVIGLAFYYHTAEGFAFAKTFCVTTLGGIVAYIIGNLKVKDIQKKP